MLLARSGTTRSTATTAGRTRPAAADRRFVREIGRANDRRQDEKKDHRVHEQRRNDPFPISFLFLPRFEGWVARDYFTSFGVAAMTLTPEPRATSIAAITSWYLTLGSPFTKMILSGRGS